MTTLKESGGAPFGEYTHLVKEFGLARHLLYSLPSNRGEPTSQEVTLIVMLRTLERIENRLDQIENSLHETSLSRSLESDS